MEKLGINWGLLVAQLVNVILIVWLLSMLLYRPVLNMLNERTRRIQESLKEAEQVKEQLARANQDYDAKLALDRLPGVVQAFEQYSKGEARAMTGEVVSAVDLSDTQRSTILNDLRGRYGDRLDLRFSTDPSLIGGLIIRVGDQVLDNSLRARLSAIQRNMLAS